MDDDADVGPRVEDVVAEVAGLVGLAHGVLEPVGDLGVLAADEDEGAGRAGGHRRDRDALDEQVRVLEHQLAVLEGARLGLVGVAAEVLVHVPARQEARLLAHREAGAAASSQPRVLQFGEQILRLDLPERPLQSGVAAEPLVGLDRCQPRLVDVLEQHAGLTGLSHGSQPGSAPVQTYRKRLVKPHGADRR